MHFLEMKIVANLEQTMIYDLIRIFPRILEVILNKDELNTKMHKIIFWRFIFHIKIMRSFKRWQLYWENKYLMFTI